jgi:hypothetical protein
MGSSTAAAGWLGFGGSGGTTWKDEECIRRLNAIMLANTLQEKAAAKELMCGNREINEVYTALERATGEPVSCLMDPSTSTAIPGGALENYRKIRPARVRAPVTPVATAVPPANMGEQPPVEYTDKRVTE